jgi:uncharacterized protein (DUF58 family)
MIAKSDQLIDRLELTVLKRLDGLLQGNYRTFFQGFGMDLADLREYQFGDDVRTIEWNISARLQQTYVRRHYEDRELPVWLIVDASASIDFGTADRRKRDLLHEAVIVWSRIVGRQGNRLGAIISDGGRSRIIPARTGRRQAITIWRTLADWTGRSSALTDLGAVLREAFQIIPHRALVLVFSDFISVAGWERASGTLAHRHELIAVHLADPRETELPDIGPVWFEDAETGEQLFVDTADQQFRQRFKRLAAERLGKLRQSFKATAVELLELSTNGDLVPALLPFLAKRRWRKAGIGTGYRPTQRWPQ